MVSVRVRARARVRVRVRVRVRARARVGVGVGVRVRVRFRVRVRVRVRARNTSSRPGWSEAATAAASEAVAGRQRIRHLLSLGVLSRPEPPGAPCLAPKLGYCQGGTWIMLLGCEDPEALGTRGLHGDP